MSCSLVEGLLVDKLTLCTPLATGSKLHLLIKVVILEGTDYWVNLGQL